ncbi:MAG: hypothetical protein AB1611_05055 [bacterium]
MSNSLKYFIGVLILWYILQMPPASFLSPAFRFTPGSALAQGSSQPQAQPQEGEKKLLSRIDFGNSYILGQSIKSGAVYLLQRKKNEIKSMLSVRKEFRKEILEDFPLQDRDMTKKSG